MYIKSCISRIASIAGIAASFYLLASAHGAAAGNVQAAVEKATQPATSGQVKYVFDACGRLAFRIGIEGAIGSAETTSCAFAAAPFAFHHLLREQRDQVAENNEPDASTITASIRREPVRPSAEAVFASVALPMRNLPALARIDETYAELRRGDLFDCTARDCPARQAALADVVADDGSRGFMATLGAINAAVNGIIAYRSDAEVYGERDYWATPSHTLADGAGDCEDFALLKMAALEAVGVPSKSMSIVVLLDERRNLFHAVLSVRTNQGYFILDNVRDAVLMDSDIRDYLPLYSISAGRGYIHGRPAGGSYRLAGAASLEEIAPGVGPVASPGEAVLSIAEDVFPVE